MVEPSQAATNRRPPTNRAPSRFVFTKKRLDALPPPITGRDYYRDEKQRGLELRVYPTGRKMFALYRKIDGRADRVTIGLYPDLSVEQARDEAQALLGEIAQGGNPAHERRALREEMTFAQLFEQYLEEYAKKRKRDKGKGDEDANRLYLGSLQQRKLSSITRADIVKLHGEIGRETPIAANRTASLLSGAFNFARDRGWPYENPASKIKRFPETKRDKYLDLDQLDRFRRSLEAEENRTMADYFVTALATGARRGNVMSMRWDEIHWERGVWEIPAVKAKTKTAMNVILVVKLLELLERRKNAPDADPEWVFPGRKGRTDAGHIVEVKTAWERITKRAGIKGFRPHDLRHTLASWQVNLGATGAIVGKSLEHRSAQTTQRYMHLHLDPVRDSVQLANDVMFGVVKPKGLLPEKTRKP